MAFDVLAAGVGAALALSSAYTLRVWQYKRDALLSKIERLCALVEAQADLSTQYWLIRSTAETEIELKALEARIIGKQAQIDGYYELAKARLLHPDRETIEHILVDLSNSATGGQFSVARRNPDFERASRVQSTAADFVVELRRSALEAFTLIGTVTYHTRY